MPADPIVILTREPEDNLALADKLKERGIETYDYPCLATRLLPYHGREICRGKKLEDFQVVAFTSKRGVAGMKPVFKRLKDSAQILAAVGDATAKAIEQEIGRKAGIIAEPQTGEGLAKAIIAKLKTPAPVLYVQGDKTSGEFKKILKQNGFIICGLVVYENYSPELKPLTLKSKALAVFASPSAAKLFFKVNPHLKNSLSCIAIGPTTEKFLTSIGIKRIAVASRPDPDYLIKCILKTIAEGERV